ncbi:MULTISPECIES: UDP-glucose dehydrogenase family protein [Roseivirga]|jgi:UDPglucose 6-dehydrogenase|uniref:UDP-glucose 6-dehydrogenase n=1 Tax=Roseivirga spongicola TaxID=333140 RepID=A0A150XHN7_9BACT|nr:MULTISPECIES: UDP-glucose/GDP-mannose dehydrogenase family protein [Roseivirga]KYG78214.1 UDP-glucose 6-dehydrogenase [Roseivirga spongicola]MBO6497687.1 UDP-glucose/GDP-mannose dehydrogenase family protein [Roseivirga sp.]MBO6660962.1 UDP-glucose/GDP-mannose dehydrogenase family protein [Roseivirga sp.]MBO6909054.1 UDP-glucose/GDP-mannose dehydrogenase family protein [Roseivirga sp.]WPZ11959.1 UDP-glucose/GDP-mannose dehydrogenase family protein [Roseivirga spongicola]
MKITIVGTGYVGLVTGTCFSEVGINVTCIDIDQKKIEGLKNGVMPIYEPGLEPMVKSNLEKGRLHFSTSLKDNLKDSEAVFIAVGTPPGEDGSADLKYVLAVAREVGQHMEDYMVVVTKSTVPVGTAKKVKAAVQEELDNRGANIDFDVASNPEFLKEGAAIQDFLKPDRIVVGVESEKARKIMEKLYKPFLLNGHPTIFMDVPSAEMTKYAANSMLATKISFMNDVANLCEIMGADVNMVRKGIGSDSRIGTKFIYPGVGYGGSCFPKDVKALIKTADENGYKMRVLTAVEEVNEAQKSVMVAKVKKHFGEDLSGMTFGIWGLSFKPKTDDMREAPSIVIINQLMEAGAKVKAFDPVAMEEAHRDLGDSITYAKDEYDAIVDTDALLLVTEWPEFRIPNFNVVSKLLKNKVIFDGRNIYDREELRSLGYTYYGIGLQ